MVIKDKISGVTRITLDNEDAILSAGPNSFTSTISTGNFINGAVSFSSSFTKIKFGGIFRFNSLLANTIPSTVITPIPALELDLPMKEAASLLSVATLVLSTL